MAMLVAIGCGGASSPTSPTSPSSPSTLRLTCPANAWASSTSSASVAVSFPAPTPTGGKPPVSVRCAPASGSLFAVGTTSVRCTATAANRDTASCSFDVTVMPPAPRIAKTRYLAFGDSLTAGEVTVPVETSDFAEGGVPYQPLMLVPQASYPTQLEMLLRARYAQQSASISVTNAGKSGEYATAAAERFPGIAADLRPEVVLLLTGANDLALGMPGLTRAVRAVNEIAREARFRNARVFIATLTPPKPGGSRTLTAATVESYNAQLAAVARGEGAVLVDLYSALLPGVSTYIGSDGLHPTEAGYRRMAEAFLEAIQREFETRQ